MQFDSFREFLVMGGHGPYVWAAYAITLAVLLGLVVSARQQRRRFFRQQAARLKRERARAEVLQ